jgi:hypothetical protein
MPFAPSTGSFPPTGSPERVVAKGMKSRRSAGVPCVAVLVAVASACSDSGPTSATPSTAPDVETSYSFAAASELAEDFDCSHVGEIRARFGPPGFVDGNHVGLYLFFGGIAEGPKRLRIWWDYENDGATFRDFVLPGDATEHEGIYEHRYVGLGGTTEMLVRVELILDGLTGNCARNRRVGVAPPEAPSAPPAPIPPAIQTGNVGPPVTAVDSTGFGPDGIRFTALRSLTIVSVAVDAGSGSGTVVINLMDSTGSVVLATTSASVTPGPQRVNAGFNVAPGDYVLCLDASSVVPSQMGTTFGSATFPYTIAGVISLTDTAFNLGFLGWYYYLYDWQVTW